MVSDENFWMEKEREQSTSRQKKRCSVSISSPLAEVAINDLYLNEKKAKRLREETISEICRVLSMAQGAQPSQRISRHWSIPLYIFLSRWNGVEDGRWAGSSAVSFFFSAWADRRTTEN